MKSFFYSFVLLSALFLTGCTNADAGKDQTVYSGDTVTLDAGNSSGDSNKLRYHWTQVEGVPVQLSGEDTVRATFIAPNVKKRKRLLFKLTVMDENSHAMSQDYIAIIIEPRVTLPRDVTAPSITLNGETTLTLAIGDTYTEFGATATDDRDGSVDVTISGTVDTTKAGDYTVTYTASDKTGNTATAARTVTVILPADTTSPVITLNGETTLTLTVGDTYTEFGATATDDRDGSVDVTISGTVDTTKAGDYTVTYTASDKTGNTATAARTVTVILPADTTSPVITLNGETTLTLTVGDTYTEFGATATDDRDGSVDVTISGTVDTTKAGDYTVTYTASDKTGNTATAARTVTVIKEEASTGTIHGTVIDIAGKPLKGVKIYSTSYETFTDLNGKYTLNINGTSPVSIVTELAHYMQNSKVLDINRSHTQNFVLLPVDKIDTFDAQIGAEIQTKGAKVNFPPSSIIDENGTEYIGKVIVNFSYHRVTSDLGRVAFPGEYIGKTTEGNTTVLRSYGFMEVTIHDEQGNPLKINDTTKVTLTYPMDKNIKDIPKTIALWYYDIKKGIWIEDGLAVYNKKTNTYSGDVTHFTIWSIDTEMNNSGKIKGCVEDNFGNPITNASIKIRADDWSWGRVEYVVESESNFTFTNVPTQSDLYVKAVSASGTIGSQIEFLHLHENEEHNISNCFIIDYNTTTSISIVGRLVDTNGNPTLLFTSYLIKATKTNTTLGYGEIHNGLIQSGQIIIPEDRQITIQTSSEDNNTASFTYLLNIDSSNNTYDLGDIIVYEFTGRLLDIQDNIISTGSIKIYDVQNPENQLGSATINQDGTFISRGLDLSTYESVLIKIDIDGTIIEQIINLNNTNTTEIGDIHTSLTKLKGQITNSNGEPITATEAYIINSDNNETIRKINIGTNGTIDANYFELPLNGNIKLRFRKDWENAVYTERSFHFDQNDTMDVGTISLDIVRFSAKLLFQDGAAMPNNTMMFLSSIDTDTSNSGGIYINNDGTGNINSGDFFRPTNNQIKIRVPLKGDDFVTTVNLNEVEDITNKEFLIDAVIISGTVSYAHTDTPPGTNDIYIDQKNVDPYAYEAVPTQYHYDTNSSTFSYGPFLRPIDNNITLVARRYGINGKDRGTTFQVPQDTHSVTIGNYLLQTSKIQACVTIPNGTIYNELHVRYNEPFVEDISTYNNLGHIDKDTGTYDTLFWQNDLNETLYVFATNTNTQITTGMVTFIPNIPLVDLTNHCLNLDTESDISTNITVTMSEQATDANIRIEYRKSRSFSDSPIAIASSKDTLTFNAHKNGIYTIKQYSSSNTFGGTITLSSDHDNKTITLSKEERHHVQSWIIYEIEIYQGTIKINKINRLDIEES